MSHDSSERTIWGKSLEGRSTVRIEHRTSNINSKVLEKLENLLLSEGSGKEVDPEFGKEEEQTSPEPGGRLETPTQRSVSLEERDLREKSSPLIPNFPKGLGSTR